MGLKKLEKLEHKIDTELISEESFLLEEFVEDISNDFDKEGFLLEGTFSKGYSNGTFKSDLWAAEDNNTKTNAYFDFSDLNTLKFKNIQEDDILLIKCWLAEFFMYGYRGTALKTKYGTVVNFLDITSNFSDNFLVENKGNDMEFLRDRENGVDDNYISSIIDDIKNYIFYRLDIGYKINNNTIGEYLSGLDSLQKNLNRDRSVRELPKNRDALKFGYYVDLFFNDIKILQDLKTYYMPILIWWKVSTVIPIRPTEICTKMERDCLIPKNDRLYIKIKRAKRSNVKLNTKKRAVLPLLDRLEISEGIYKLIENYIKLTDSYGHTNTLFSYRALRDIRSRLINLDEEKYSFLGSKASVYRENLKNDEDTFTSIVLGTLLRSFYKNIIRRHYSDNSIEDLNLHDTRHYAFTSLLLQGLTPVEIAIIGGHTRVFSQDNYQCNVKYYVDHEIVNFVNSKKLGGNFSNKDLKEIIFRMPKDCPKPLEECMRTEDNIGYCTVDITNDGLVCENDEFCFKCSNWWCSPIEENYDLLRKYIQNQCIAPLEEKLEFDEDYLQGIINQMSTTSELDGVTRSDVNEDLEVKRLAKKLRSDADKLVDLKKILLDLTMEDEEKQQEEKIQLGLINAKQGQVL